MQVKHLRTIGSSSTVATTHGPQGGVQPKAPAGREAPFEIARRPHDETIAALERSPAFQKEVAKTQFQIVKLAGSNLEVMIPANGSFDEYVRRLAKTCSFPDQVEEIKQLGRTATATAMPIGGDQRPVVGVLISEPKHLLLEDAYSSIALCKHIERMGCRPVLIPPRLDLLFPNDRTKRWASITAMVGKLDGIAGPGGADVHPRMYGQLNRFSLHTNYPRDRFEGDVAIAGMRSDVSMLGVCRSHQLWNAISGGTLVQDVRKEGYSSTSLNQSDFGIPDEAPFVVRDRSGKIVRENRVYVDKSSELGRAAGGADSIVTNSFHHQAVDRPGKGFKVTGVVRDEKLDTATIEATESANAITVQWHPEIAPPERRAEIALIDTFGRRAHIFHMLRGLRASGTEPTIDGLIARMKARPELLFSGADYEWVRRELAARVSSRAL